MTRFFTLVARYCTSPGLTPFVASCFLAIYCSVAFGTDDALAAVMELVRSNLLLQAFLALIPLNALARIVSEVRLYLARRAVMRGGSGKVSSRPFDEVVELKDSLTLQPLAPLLLSSGYRVRCHHNSLSAYRGWSATAARVLLLAALLCLSIGVLLSLVTRTVRREAVIEGEPFPQSQGRLVVRQILFPKINGWLFERDLKLVVGTEQGGPATLFGLYPPSRFAGAYIYPRYLGLAPLVRFSGPDLDKKVETHFILMIYPPGKEDSADIPDSPYRIYFTVTPTAAGEDLYETGRFHLNFRLVRSNVPVVSGSVAPGGQFSGSGYRLEFPSFKRVVATDLVYDYGVSLIWVALMLAPFGLFALIAVTLFFPRREMYFLTAGDGVCAFSRAEGKRRPHDELFNKCLDMVSTERSGGVPL